MALVYRPGPGNGGRELSVFGGGFITQVVTPLRTPLPRKQLFYLNTSSLLSLGYSERRCHNRTRRPRTVNHAAESMSFSQHLESNLNKLTSRHPEQDSSVEKSESQQPTSLSRTPSSICGGPAGEITPVRKTRGERYTGDAARCPCHRSREQATSRPPGTSRGLDRGDRRLPASVWMRRSCA